MEEINFKDMRKVVKTAFIKIGIRGDMLGFEYLCSAVEFVAKNPRLLHNLGKGLYVEIGKKYDVQNPSSVERSIHNAIDNTFVTHSFAELNKMYNTQLYTIDDKPKVGELIQLVKDYYLLGLYKEN